MLARLTSWVQQTRDDLSELLKIARDERAPEHTAMRRDLGGLSNDEIEALPEAE